MSAHVLLNLLNKFGGKIRYWALQSILLVFPNKFNKFGNTGALMQDSVYHLSPVKRICVFEHSVMTNFNCACPAIQRGQGSGFLSEGSS